MRIIIKMINNSDLDVRYVQNTAIGAVLLWRFACSYYQTENKPVPFLIFFLVLPLVFREDLCSQVQSTNKSSGLSKFCEKLFVQKKNDEVESINNTSIKMRSLTIESFNIAVEANLLSLTPENALVYPVFTKLDTSILHDETIKLLSVAEKIGFWFSNLSLHEITKWLKVRF